MMRQKILITLLFVTSCLVGRSQQAAPAGNDLKTKIAAIDAYVSEVDNNKDIRPYRNYNGEFEHSIYSQSHWALITKTPWAPLKVVTVTQNLNAVYYKDGKKVYMTDISAVHDNVSKIVTTYFENDTAIYTGTRLYEEQILQINCGFNGAEQGGNYNLKIDRDSISLQHFSNKPLKIANTPANWEKLKNSFTLSDFDKVKTGGFRSYIDGHDMAYTITTDKREHAFVNAYGDPSGMKKLARLIELIGQNMAAVSK